MAASEHLLNPKLLLQPDLVCLQLLHWPLQCASSNQALSQLSTLTQASSHITHYPWFCGQLVLYSLSIWDIFFLVKAAQYYLRSVFRLIEMRLKGGAR